MKLRSGTFSQKGIVYIVAAIALCTCAPLQAQVMPDRVYLEHIDVPGNARAANAVDILQDPAGLLWFGTTNGLYRYDGYNFTLFDFVEPDSFRLDGREINALQWDRAKERLLIGTRHHGLLAYSYETDKLQRLVRTEGIRVDDIVQTNDGALWISSLPSGLYKLERDSLRKLDLPDTVQAPLALLAHGNQVLVGLGGNVAVLENGKEKRVLPFRWNGRSFSAQVRVASLMIDEQNRLWVGSDVDGILQLDLATGEPVHYLPPERAPFFSRTNAMLQDDRGLVWILTKAEGVALYNPATDELRHLQRDPTDPYAISGNNGMAIVQDRSGIVWIGTNGAIDKYDRDKRKFTHFVHDPHRSNSLSDNMVRAIYVDRNDEIWIGTDGGYINLVDHRTLRVSRIKVELAGVAEPVIPLSFAELGGDQMLVGTSHGLLLMDRSMKSFEHYRPLQHILRGRVRQLVKRDRQLYALVEGNVWLYDHAKQRAQPLGNFNGEATYIHVDADMQVWVGSADAVSLLLPDGQTRRTTLSTDSLPHMVLSIQDIGGVLWVNTEDDGFYRLKINNGQPAAIVQHVTAADGLPDNTVYGALPDEAGHVWLSTDGGLVRFTPSDTTFIRFDVSEGVQDEEFNRLAFGRTANGKMIFGGINGLNMFDPGKVSVVSRPVTPLLFDLITHNAESAANGRNHYSLLNRKKLRLKHTQNFFTIHFGSTDFRTPVRYRYQYKLDHVDERWVDAPHNQANYTELEPGEYVFRVRVKGQDGTTGEAAVTIHIVPPFYKTWWFNVLAFVAAGVIVVGVIQGRIQQDKLDKHRLETLLTMRTQEIEKSREELKSLNQKKDLIFSILSHDLRSPLTTLKGFLGVLIEDADSLPKDALKKYAATIRNSVTNSLDLIDNTLFWSLSQMGNITHNPTNVSINVVFDKLKGLYQLTAEKKKIHLTYTIDGPVSVYGDENMIYVTLRNLVSNALKFTPEGKAVSVSCRNRSNVAEITIRDEGVGMSEEYLGKVLSMKQPTLKTGTLNEKGTGLGLLLCKDFVDMNGGTLSVTSVEHQGTTFVVTFPLEKVGV